METLSPDNGRVPFPLTRPTVQVIPLTEPAFEVEWQELPWWFITPREGESVLWAIYDLPDCRLGSFTCMDVLRPARIHGVEGVEIRVADREPDTGWRADEWRMFARQTGSVSEYLATLRAVDGSRILYTFLDDGFDADWGRAERRLVDCGHFEELPDGSYRQLPPAEPAEGTVHGVGLWEVRVGSASFRCLRVLDVRPAPTLHDTLMEGFITEEGRTVLCRRHNAVHWSLSEEKVQAGALPWDQRLPEARRLVIDGVTFVHWYDCLSGEACGIGG